MVFADDRGVVRLAIETARGLTVRIRRLRVMSWLGRFRVSGWTAVSWFLLVACVAISLAAAGAWRAQVWRQPNAAFDAEAASVGSSVTTALRRMDDLTVAARTLVGSNPELTNAELASWYRSIGAQRRYPGALGFGYMELVPAAQLSRYVAQIRADPIPGMSRPAHDFKIIPPGRRASYCLVRLGVAGVVNRLIPGGYSLDVCGVPGVYALLSSRDTGATTTFLAPLTAGERVLTVSAPVYRGGVVPSTVAERRARMLGWMTGVFNVKAILGTAVAGDRGLAVTVSRQDAAPSRVSRSKAARSTTLKTVSTVATIGAISGGSPMKRQFSLDADGLWTVTVAKVPRWQPFSPTVQELLVLIGGLLVSILLFLLVHVLALGRVRALRLVAEKTAALRHLALHDALTGLPNRALIMDRTRHMLARARREQKPVAAMFIDLDGFKKANDTFGHGFGDLLLCEAARRISNTLRESDTVGRLGGDEFVVLVEGGSEFDPELVAERILGVLAEPFELDTPLHAPLAITASIGIAIAERLGVDDAGDLLRDADIAMYAAKAEGKNRWVVFRRDMRVAVHERMVLEQDLRDALQAGQLKLVYQPIFDLGDGTVTGIEALLRWQHPTRGLVQPNEFIPIADESGLIVAIGRWVLDEACRQAADWHAKGYEVDISVNISARQLDEPGLPDAVSSALAASGLDPIYLILEITETTLMRDPSHAAQRLDALKSLGVRIAIDDFGSSYSSLAQLQQFPVDAIKIDRTFIQGIATSLQSRTLVRTLVQLGKTLQLDTIAEGIEDRDELRSLRDEACDAGQGFLLARPVELDAIELVLASAPPRRSREKRGVEPAIDPRELPKAV